MGEGSRLALVETILMVGTIGKLVIEPLPVVK